MTSTIGFESRLARLEQRVSEQEDREAIRGLLAAYGFNADLGRHDSWLDLWTEDGVYDFGAGRSYSGREELRTGVVGNAEIHGRIENRSQHLCSNITIDVTGDTAWAEFYSIVMVRMPSDRSPRFAQRPGEQGYDFFPWSCGYNRCDFVRQDGTWRLSRRVRRTVGGEQWGGDVIAAYLSQSALAGVADAENGSEQER